MMRAYRIARARMHAEAMRRLLAFMFDDRLARAYAEAIREDVERARVRMFVRRSRVTRAGLVRRVNW